MTIKYNDFKLTQTAANAEPQKWRQIFPKFGRSSAEYSHVAEPNIRPNSNIGPSLAHSNIVTSVIGYLTFNNNVA